jgi:homoserine kinase
MQLGADHVRVRVPATSANLGPGFDALGLALALHDVLEVRALASDEVVVQVQGEGAGEVPSDETHLVVRALRAALDVAGAPQTGLHLSCVNRIPHGRGLGSSAAAVVAGIVAARELVADPTVLDDDVVLGLATAIEGHPDNAAPALLGGATVAWTGASTGGGAAGAGARGVRLGVHPDVRATVLVPSARLATSRARGVLPERVPHADAAFNAGRAALLVEALGRRPELLLDATDDRLHQAYRADVMPSSFELVQALRSQGLAATVSGAGPTVLVLSTADADDHVARVLDALLGGTVDWALHRLDVDTQGVQGERLSGT